MINPTQLKEVYQSFPDNCLLLKPDYPKFTIVEANRSFEKASGVNKNKLVGNGILEVFGGETADRLFIKTLSESLKNALETGQPDHIAEVRYDLPDPKTGKIIPKFWEADNIPINNSEGKTEFILHRVRDITQVIENREKEQATLKNLQENERLLKETQEVAQIGSWELDTELNTLHWSETLKKIHEVPQDFIPDLDSAINFYKTEEDKNTIRKAVEKAINDCEGFDLELEIITAKNNEKWIRATGKAEFKNGKCTRVLGATQDITSRKLTEIRLENINDNIPGVVFRYKLKANGEDELMYVSEGAKEVWGITPNEVALDSSKIWDIYYEDDIESHKQAILESAKNLSLWTSEWRVRHPEKGIRWNRGIGAPQKFSDGSIVWDSIVLDVTQEKIAYELLQLNESRQRSLLDSQTNYVIRTDIEGNYTYFNNKFKEDFGWIHEEMRLIGESCMIAVVEEDRHKVEEIAIKCLENPEKTFQVEIRKPRRDGNVRTTVWDFIALCDTEGNPTEIQCIGIDISEKKEAEIALNNAKKQYEALVESIDGVFWELDIETFEFTFVSDQAKDLLRIKPEDWYHDPKFWENHIHPEDRDFAVSFCRNQVENGVNHSFEYRMLKGDGDYIWVSDVVSVVRDNGKPKWLRGILTDISKRKQTEKELEEKRTRLDKIMNESLDIISIIDANGIFIQINKAAENILGYLIEELHGRAFMDLVFKDDIEKTEKAAIDIMNGIAMTNFENRYVAKNGEIIPLTWSAYWDKKDGFMYAIARDSRERKRAEEQLQLSEQRFKGLVQDGGDLIALLNEKGEYIYASPTSISVLGYEPSEFYGNDAWNFIHPEDVEQVQTQFTRLSSEKRIEITPFRFKHKTKGWRWLESTVTNLLEDPAINGIVANSRDITEKKYFQDFEDLEKKVLERNFDKDFSLEQILDFYLSEIENFHSSIFLSLLSIDDNKFKFSIAPSAPNSLILNHLKNLQNNCTEVSNGKTEKFDTQSLPASDLKKELVKNSIHSILNFPVISSSGEILGIFSAFIAGESKDNFLENALQRTLRLLQLIIEFKQKEKALKLSNQRYKFVNKATRDAIYDWDIISNNIEWGIGFKKLFGYTSEKGEFPIEKWNEKVHSEDATAVQENLDSVLQDPKIKQWNSQYRFKTSEGKYLNISENGYILRNENGEAYRMIGALRDITELYAYEKELFISNERYKYLTKATADAMWDWDLESSKMYWGEGFRTLFGHDLGLLKSDISSWTKFIHPDDHEAAAKSLDEAITGNHQKWEAEYRFGTAEGTYKYVFDRGYIVRDKTGKAIRAVGAMQDISKHKEYEASLKNLNENLQRYTKELEISNSELEQFAYVASHDLQEPLRMVTSFLNQLEKKYASQLDEKAHTYINFAVDGAKRMREIILDLLEFSRVGRNEDKLEEVDLNRIIFELKNLYRKEIKDAAAVIENMDLPIIAAPKGPVRQVFQNLISNSLKYRKSKVAPLIEIGFEENATHYIFYVSDNGIGIDPEYFDKIFIIFQRLHQREKYSGTGMGLAITKKIVENLGGNVWLESAEGKGSTFFFSISKILRTV